MKLRKKRKLPGIPMSAMGDIAFLLLVFYMATTMVTDQKPMDTELPEVRGEAINSPYPLKIYMSRELAEKKQVFFFSQYIPLSELAGRLEEQAARAPARVRVYLNLDRDVPYARMHDVIQVLKETGFVSRVVISSRPPGSQRNSQSETTFPDSNAPSGNTN